MPLDIHLHDVHIDYGMQLGPGNAMKLETTFQTVLGRLIAAKRQRRHMDQGALAHHVGVTRSTWSRIEAGLSALSVEHLVKAASALGVSVSELTTEADEVVRGLRQEDVAVRSSRDQTTSNMTDGSAPGEAVGTRTALLEGRTLTAMVASIMRGHSTMGYEYRPDEGLDFLEGVSSEDLGGLVEFLTDQRNQELADSERYKLYYPDHSKYWREIATEIQTFGGNTISNLYRGEGTYYRDILHDVCKRRKADYNEGMSIQAIEGRLLEKELADLFERIEPDQRTEVLKILGEHNAQKAQELALSPKSAAAAAQVLLRASGFAAYKWALIAVNATIGTISKIALGKGLSLAANAAVTRYLSIAIGPVGWALTGAWTAYELSGPAYRVTIPSVLYIAALRLKQQQDNNPEGDPVTIQPES